MKTLGLTDVLGPILIGPSSSHTAGALRIASMARRLCEGELVKAEFFLLGSFALTYKGHGSDKALCAGVLGLAVDDDNVPRSLELAEAQGLEVVFTPLPDAPYDHPDTLEIELHTKEGRVSKVRGESLGGGLVELTSVDGVNLTITGLATTLLVKHEDAPGVLAFIATRLSEHGLNIAKVNSYREHRAAMAYTVMETDGWITEAVQEELMQHDAIESVLVLEGEEHLGTHVSRKEIKLATESFMRLDFASAAEMENYAMEHQVSLAEAFRAREEAFIKEAGLSHNIDDYLDKVLEVMRNAATKPLHTKLESMGGLIGGEALKLQESFTAGQGVGDGQLSSLCVYAMATLETNDAMGHIVAAPTSGSSGVLPAVLFTLQDQKGYTNEQLKQALLVASAVGYIITRNATTAGAEGGCQAEVGSASAMAAAAAAYLAGGSVRQCLTAASNALTNLMGLICDPIGGLVEIPCQKRNAGGAVVAMVGAELALAGIDNLVPFDQTVEAMMQVGRCLPFELRESGLGGLAGTEDACAWCAENL